ncbi:FxsA family membrane protein [Streptomyces sp. I05A-00742]|uniref:FxsA family membrane protein n=1 Tax=Streptomyces sp. I05A-00742 TaxID=2732853 RepID=UPI00148879AE|nr:FxsA family membrane protein [Streptomyces sp. I05A-00742]
MTFGTQQQQPKQRRTRKLLPLAVAAWAVLEIYLLILVADAAGGLAVFGLLAGGVVLGAYVIKRAGRRAWQRLTRSMQAGGAAGAAPDVEGGGNGLTMLGGLLLMVPGLVSDVAGLLCLFPPTRALIRKTAVRRIERAAEAGPLGDAVRQARMHRPGAGGPDGKVVQGEVIRDDEGPAPRTDDPQLPR